MKGSPVFFDYRPEAGFVWEVYQIASTTGMENAKGWRKGPVAVRENCVIVGKDVDFVWVLDHVKSGRKLGRFDAPHGAYALAQMINECPVTKKYFEDCDGSIELPSPPEVDTFKKALMELRDYP